MKAHRIWAAVGVVALATAMASAGHSYAALQIAQGYPVTPADADAPVQPVYEPPQLDQLLAPIALYPDDLLGQVLIAATYPLEVVEATRWLDDPNNAGLRGDDLAAALDQLPWDPSVKALVPFPQVLRMMSTRLDWTQRLGDAFLAQEPDVMDSVQRLRQQAQAAGRLVSTPQQVVEYQGPIIVIRAASPRIVYIPVYNPTVVYGRWRYPAYPPYYFPPPRGYVVGDALAAGIFFGVGVAIVDSLWGWDHWDWGRHRFRIDVDRYNVINRYNIVTYHRPRLERDVWEHDPYHRRGVVYRDVRVRERYTKVNAGAVDARRDYRGYDNRRPANQQVNRPGGGGAAVANRQPDARPGGPSAQGRPGTDQAYRPPRVGPGEVTPKVGPGAVTPKVGPGAVTPKVGPGEVTPRVGPGAVTPKVGPGEKTPQTGQAVRPQASRQPPAAQRPAAAPQRPPSAALEGVSKGADARANAERGRASRQTPVAHSAPAAPKPPARPAPAARSAPQHPPASGTRPKEKQQQ